MFKNKLFFVLAIIGMLVACGAGATFTLTTDSSGGGGSCPQGNGVADGCSSAPAGTPQLPHLLDVKQVTALNIPHGSGYTNGTYTWTTTGGVGSGATGTVTVAGGALGGPTGQQYTITNQGTNYTSRPTIAIPAGAGSGSGGSITPTVYQTRPSWNVAGVDYYVGVPVGTILRDPSTGGVLPSGCGYSAGNPGTSAHLVNCGGGSIVLNAFDFCAQGGITLYVGANTNITVTNSNFCGGFNTYGGNVIGIAAGTGSAQFLNNTFDGGGVAGVSNNYASGMVQYMGTGTFDYRYNICKNVDQHCLDIGVTGTSGTQIIKYNVGINIGTNPGAHGELAYWCGDKFTGIAQDFNLVLDQFLPLNNTAGIALAGDNGCVGTGSVRNSSVSNNVALMQGTQSYVSGSNPSGQIGAGSIYVNGDVNSTVTVSGNYVDYSGVYFPFYPASSGLGINFTSTNVNIGSGNAGCYPASYGTGTCE